MSRDGQDKKARLDLVGASDAEIEGVKESSAEALRAALEPGELDDADHEAILAMTLGDEAAAIDDDERHAAERLRLALEGRGADPLAELASSLRAVERAGELAQADHEAILALSLGDEAARVDEPQRADAEKLRLALEGRGADPLAELAGSLRALQGRELAGADHEALLALSLGDDAATVDASEREAAERLRLALDGEGSEPLAELAGSLRAAAGDMPGLDELSQRRLLQRVMKAPLSPRRIKPGRGPILGAIVALAAGVALMIGSMQWIETQGGGVASRQDAPQQVELVEARSTQELFDPMTPFPTKGGESERLGKIVQARSADLRANRFAAWGVR